MIAQARLADNGFSVDAPVHYSSLGGRIGKYMIELIGTAPRREERPLLLGKEAPS
jgi:hypothetical protein